MTFEEWYIAYETDEDYEWKWPKILDMHDAMKAAWHAGYTQGCKDVCENPRHCHLGEE